METEPTYIELVCEARLNPTEKREKIETILKTFLDGDIVLDERFDGNYLVVRNSGWDGLNLLSDWIRRLRLLDTIRRRLLKSSLGNITAIYFNKQAAAMGKLSLVDVNDNPPLGSISYQIVSDNLEYVVNKFTPRTFEGKVITEEEWEMIKQRKNHKTTKK
jgi:predicted RNA binding protein with dsRBD fold (UPF0201 family)